MFNWFDELVFSIKFWFKKRKLMKLDPFIYEVPNIDQNKKEIDDV